jgi:hypothetical protein
MSHIKTNGLRCQSAALRRPIHYVDMDRLHAVILRRREATESPNTVALD